MSLTSIHPTRRDPTNKRDGRAWERVLENANRRPLPGHRLGSPAAPSSTVYSVLTVNSRSSTNSEGENVRNQGWVPSGGYQYSECEGLPRTLSD